MEMKTKVTVKSIFHCSLERAFKTPMLCDVSKVHTGYGIMPRVTHCTDDADWGKPGSSKNVFVAASLTQKGGFGSVDNVIERLENKYWKIEINNFQSWMLGCTKFVGEWKTTEIEAVSYTHIRAHETVLDLVCRLLLEKKKHQLHTQTIKNRKQQTHHDTDHTKQCYTTDNINNTLT